ncbi:MAG TPA: NAD(P)-dependent oxidoreductase [Alphaproteobacteria bacterium]|nr:NAD(P)-dependent oxidoreductase [Alphaproteobacteria bacterium]
MASKPRIGMIGLGLMGHGIAKNIVTKGYSLAVVAHRNRKPVDDLVSRGAREAPNSAELARGSDIVFICVTGSPEVEDVLRHRGGVLEGLNPGTIVADCSTAEPSSTLRMGALVEARGGRFVDAPLVRTPKEAEEGRLAVITGGDRDTLAELRPVLDCFAEVVVHAGPIGAAHKLKLIANFLALANAAAVAEGFISAMKGGVDLKALVQVCQSGGADSVMLRRLATYLLEGDDSAAKFAIATATKDLRYYTHMAEAAPTAAFIAEAVHQTYALAAIAGYGERYLARLIDALAALNGVQKSGQP